MDRRAAALAAQEIAEWAHAQDQALLDGGPHDAGGVWADLAEAADDLAHMIRTLDRHLPADG